MLATSVSQSIIQFTTQTLHTNAFRSNVVWYTQCYKNKHVKIQWHCAALSMHKVITPCGTGAKRRQQQDGRGDQPYSDTILCLGKQSLAPPLVTSCLVLYT